MDGKKVLRFLLDVLVLSLTLKHNEAAAGDSCLASSECLNGGVLYCKSPFGPNGNQVDLSCYCVCPSGYFGPTCESTTCKIPIPVPAWEPTSAITPAPTATTDSGICDAPDDEFIFLEGGSPNMWRIDSFGNAVIFHIAPVSHYSLAIMRVGNTVYFNLAYGQIYKIDWCDTSDPTAVTHLVDITPVGATIYVCAMAYLRSIDKLLLFGNSYGWLSVDPITGAYTKFYPTDGSTLDYISNGAVLVDEVLYWTKYSSPTAFLRLDVSDPLNLPVHTEVSPGFTPIDPRDMMYHDGIIYIVCQVGDVYAYDPSVGGTPQLVIQGNGRFASNLTWFNATHLLISRTSIGISIVEIGTPSSPTPSSGHQLFMSTTMPYSILNLADYYIPA